MDYSKITMNPANKSKFYEIPNVAGRHVEAVQRMLQELGIKVLLVEKGVDGNDRWLNDTIPMGMPGNGIVIIPDEGEQLVINGYGIVENGPAVEVPGAPWSKTTAKIVSGVSAMDLLQMLGESRRLGVIYPKQMNARVYTYLMERIPDLEWVDLTAEYAAIKSIKLPEEVEVITAAATQCDVIAMATPSMLRAGRYEKDVVGDIRRTAYKTGSGGYTVFYQAMVELWSTPMDHPMEQAPIYYPGRMLQEHDVISIRSHISGINNYYTCIGRCYTLGEATDRLKRQWEVAVEAQHIMAGKLRPGATLTMAKAAAEEYILSQGYEPDFGSALYSLGFWMSESPMLGNETEGMPIAGNTVWVVAPGVCDREAPGSYSIACADTYLVTEAGATLLTQAPQRLESVF